MHMLCLLFGIWLLLRTEALPTGGRECPRPVLPEATYDGPLSEAENGQTVRVRCKREYVEAYPYITCVDGKWSDPEPPCKRVECEFPDNIRHGDIKVFCRQVDCKVEYTCTEGYWYTGTEVRTCQRTEKWSGTPGQCDKVVCTRIPDPEHGQVSQSQRLYLDRVTVTCDEGYTYSRPHDSIRQCQGNGNWSGESGECVGVLCPKLGDLPNGKILQPKLSYRARAEIVCNEGYVYTEPGSRVRQCQGDNTWSGSTGTCEKVPCSRIQKEENWILSADRGRFGDSITLQCPPGHALDGPSTVTCQANGNWSSPLGHCYQSEDSPNPMVAIVLSTLLVTVFAVCAFLVFLCWRNHRRKSEKKTPEAAPLIEGNFEYFCSFVTKEDFGNEYQDTVTSSQGRQVFSNIIQDQISESLGREAGVGDVVTSVSPLCQRNRKIFLHIQIGKKLEEADAARVICETKINTGTSTYTVTEGSVTFRDRVTHGLMADVHRQQHVPDKSLDKRIDLNKQYVKLKLLTADHMGAMHLHKLERPDHYQQDVEKNKYSEIEDDQLIEDGDFRKYILIRGRAGIGKSTLLQRLLWKWANGSWATQCKAIFMLNLRFLMRHEGPVKLSHLLSLYSVYNTGSANAVDAEWLQKNESNVGLILDGLDEIQSFRKHWQDIQCIPDTEASAKPLEWCFNLIRRQILTKTTVIVSSRPFADLSFIEKTMRNQDDPTNIKMVELMGLSRKRVMEFVDKNAPEIRRDFVKQTLTKNPILLSVCAITFYCAALCDVLKDDAYSHKLRTYTGITAYIMQMYIQRSAKEGRETSLVKESKVITFLSKLALRGLVEQGPDDITRLVFDQQDLEEVSEQPIETQGMTDMGLLMETKTTNPENPEETCILTQFVHLSIQECLAMAGLLKESPDMVVKTLKKLSESGQYNMALLFLYGLAFDEENGPISEITSAVGGSPENRKQLQEVLLEEVKNIGNNLQALQVAHESQSRDVAEAVGSQRFKEEVLVEGIKLTAIDIIAITFMIKHHPATHSIKLAHVELDPVCLKEIAKILQDSDDVQTLELNDNGIDDEGVINLMKGIEKTCSLETLRLTSSKITDRGAAAVAKALDANRTIKVLGLTLNGVTDKGMARIIEALISKPKLEDINISSNNMATEAAAMIAQALQTSQHLMKLSLKAKKIPDEGVQVIAEAMSNSQVLKELRILSSSLTDTGVKALAAATRNTALESLWIQGVHIQDEGVKAILRAVEEKRNLTVRIWPPECSQPLFSQTEGHSRIKWKDLSSSCYRVSEKPD